MNERQERDQKAARQKVVQEEAKRVKVRFGGQSLYRERESTIEIERQVEAGRERARGRQREIDRERARGIERNRKRESERWSSNRFGRRCRRKPIIPNP